MLFLPLLLVLTFQQAHEIADETPPYSYPYPELTKEVVVFVHGSLLDNNSARKTFSEKTVATKKLAVAFGVRRVFDRDIPIEKAPHWGKPFSRYARGMLNIYPTNKSSDLASGALLRIPEEEFEAMRTREPGYDLIPLVVADWEEYLASENPSYQVVFTFHAPAPYTSVALLPRPGYYQLTRDAAKSCGKAFYELWLKSTYLADRCTPAEIIETPYPE